MVDNCEGVDAGQDDVLGDFTGESFYGYEEDVGIADLLLGLDTPEADLAVVQGDFIWRRQQDVYRDDNERSYQRLCLPELLLKLP